MRVVLDANIFVSAAISPKGTCSQFLMKILAKPQVFELILTEKMISEILATLKKPRVAKLLKYPHKAYIKWLEDISFSATVIADIKIHFSECRDQDDLVYLAAAQHAKAELLASGDKDLLVLKSFNNTEIISPTDFSFIIEQLITKDLKNS